MHIARLRVTMLDASKQHVAQNQKLGQPPALLVALKAAVPLITEKGVVELSSGLQVEIPALVQVHALPQTQTRAWICTQSVRFPAALDPSQVICFYRKVQ